MNSSTNACDEAMDTTASTSLAISGTDSDASFKTAEGCSSNAGLASVDALYFYEDTVFYINGRGNMQYGLVTETPDMFSDDDEDVDATLVKGALRVAWYPNGKEDVFEEKTLGLVDRNLLPGDVVRRLQPGRPGQLGYVRDMSMKCDVKIMGTDYILRNVPSSRLRMCSEWQRDVVVCLGSWMGSTKSVEEVVTLQTDYGAKFEINAADMFPLKEVDCKTGIFKDSVYYPGQMLKGRISSVDIITLFTPHIPLKTNKVGRLMVEKYEVVSVRTLSVWVNWQCKSSSKERKDASEAALPDSITQPCACVEGADLKHLKRLNLFEECTLQLNDKTYLNLEANDKWIHSDEWKKELAREFRSVFFRQHQIYDQIFSHRKPAKDAKSAAAVTPAKEPDIKQKLCHNKKAKTTEIQQSKRNSTPKKPSLLKRSQSTDSWISDDGASETPSATVDAEEDEFECVMHLPEKRLCVANDSNTPKVALPLQSTMRRRHASRSQTLWTRRKGTSLKKLRQKKPPTVEPKAGEQVIAEVMLTYCTTTVVWQDGTIEENVPSSELYPIHNLDTHQFFPGDFVIYEEENKNAGDDYGVVQSVDHIGRTAHVQWFEGYNPSIPLSSPKQKANNEVSVYDLDDHPDFQFRPGSMVIRVYNSNESVDYTAGQVIDLGTDGRIKIWWIEGNSSYCYPQNLYEIASEHAESLVHDDASTASWETESECSEYGTENVTVLDKPDTTILDYLKKMRVLLQRLAEILRSDPEGNSGNEVYGKLLTIYRGCCVLDEFSDTNYFHYSNFDYLVPNENAFLVESLDNENENDGGKKSCDKESSPTKKAKTLVLKLQILYRKVLQIQKTSNKSDSTSSAETKNAESSTAEQHEETLESYDTVDSQTNSSTELQSPNQRRAFSRKTSNLVLDSLAQERNQLLKMCTKAVEKAIECIFELSPPPPPGSLARKEENMGAFIMRCVENVPTYFELSDKQIRDNERLATLLRNQLYLCISGMSNKYLKTGERSYCVSFMTDDFDDDSSNSTDEDDEEKTEPTEPEPTEPEPTEPEPAKQVELSKPTESEKTEVETQNKGSSENAKDEKKENLRLSSTILAMESTDDDVKTEELEQAYVASENSFVVLSSAPTDHHYYKHEIVPKHVQLYHKTILREYNLLKTSLPPGIWVRVYEDRIDLISFMILGPKKTPYEDGIFLFDMQLGAEYPKEPPNCFYISYCTDRLNPNLYEEGKVCVSLLNTWTGRDTEMWISEKSTLLQVMVSIQGLILVPEPYFNEAGYERQRGTMQAAENSRVYNEMAVIKMVQATTRLLQGPPKVFREIILQHYREQGLAMYQRILNWTKCKNIEGDSEKPEFPLLPLSRGFCLTCVESGLLDNFKRSIEILISFSELCPPANADAKEQTSFMSALVGKLKKK